MQSPEEPSQQSAQSDDPARSTPALSAAGRPLSPRWLAVIVTIWAGQAISIVTSYAAGYAAVWYVTETTGSAAMLSLANIFAALPIGLIAPFAGVVADKHNRKAIMVVADLSVGIVSLIMGFLIVGGALSFAALMVFVVARSVAMAFHGPAMMATLPLLVPEKHLLRINVLDQVLISIASIGAPAFGIFLYETVGFHTVMFLDFFGALAAVTGLMLAKVPTVRDESAMNQHVLANLRDGWRAVSATRGLVVVVFGVSLVMLVSGPLSALFPLMTYNHFAGGGFEVALAEAVFGGGALVGAGILVAWGGGRKLARLIVVATLIVGVTTVGCGLLPSSLFPVFLVLIAVMAVACAWFNGPLSTLMQKGVPPEKLGRAMSLITALFGLASPIGIALGGALAEAVGIAPLYVIDGVLCLLVGTAMYLPRYVRDLDES